MAQKVKLFTHTDLDGVGCYLVAAMYYGKENVDVTFCENNEVNDKIGLYINDPNESHDIVLITDISVNPDIANHIDDIVSYGNQYVLLDHHKTAEWLNDYLWARIITQYEDGLKTSGTSLLIDFIDSLESIFPREDQFFTMNFAEMVRRYDTWEWVTRYNDDQPSKLNDLLDIYGRDRFIDRILEMSDRNMDVVFEDEDKVLLEQREYEKSEYIKTKAKELETVNMGAYRVGVVFAERFLSILGNKLHEQNTELDAIVMINTSRNSCSIRTIHDHIDVSEIAKLFGGGGHPKASGFPIGKPKIESFIQYVLTNE